MTYSFIGSLIAYGCALTALGAVAMAMRPATATCAANHGRWLGAFALLHSAYAFLRAYELPAGQSASWTGVLLFVSSSSCLFEYARRRLGDDETQAAGGAGVLTSPWLYAPALGIPIVAAAFSGSTPTVVGVARLTLFLPGALGAGVAFWRGRGNPHVHDAVTTLGVAFGGYALFAGAVHGFSVTVLPWLPTESWFLSTVGVTVQAARAVCVFTIALVLGWLASRLSSLDLEQRAAANTELRESQARLQVLLDSFDQGFFIVDADLRYTEINLAGAALVGRTREELLGGRILDLFPEAADSAFVAAYRRVARTGIGEVLSEYYPPLKLWYEARVTRHDDGVAVFYSDISPRMRTTIALQQSEERLQRAQRIAKIGNWELDLTTNRLEWSPEIYRLFEVDAASFGASYEAFLATIHPDDRDAVNTAYTNSLVDQTPYQIVHRLLLRDGRIRSVEERCETDFATDGTPLFSRGTVQDVTERVRVEAVLRRSLQEKDTLLREVHHRVKNNLQVIGSLLYFHAKRAMDEQGRDAFVDARRRLQSMVLVHEKLYHSEDLSLVEFDTYLRDLVSEMRRSFTTLPANVDVTVSSDVVGLPIETALPVGMIVGELLSNAFKHAFPAGGKGRIGIEVTTTPGELTVFVADNGIGFTPGHRTPSSLGLRLVEKLSKQIRAELTIASEHGTQVTVVVPLEQGSSS